MAKRNFDNWDTYFDNDGKFLHGKVQFCKGDTTEAAPIYTHKGYSLYNPIYTNMYGQTEIQVFLDDIDYTAIFWKYIGTGDMKTWDREDYDPSRWSKQFTVFNPRISANISVLSSSAYTVSTIRQMVDTDPADIPAIGGKKYVRVLGYYKAGDMPESIYIWDSDSQKSVAPEDGGSIIRSSVVPGKGRWILCPTGELHFDVRHFGIMPQTNAGSTDYTYTSQLAHCATYLNSLGCDAYFPQLDNELSYYIFDGSNTFSINGDIYLADKVRFTAKTDTNTTIISCNDMYKDTPYLIDAQVQTGRIYLVANELKTSFYDSYWLNGARVGYIYDTTLNPLSLKDTQLRFINTTHSESGRAFTLDNVTITECEHKIACNISNMKNMAFNKEWFIDGYDFDGDISLFQNCIVTIENCSRDANLYVLMKNKMLDPNYGSLNELTLSDSKLIDGAIIEDATFENVTIEGSAEIHNVSGTFKLDTKTTTSLNLVDCWLRLTANNYPLSTLSARRCSLSADVEQLQVLQSVLVDDTEFNINLFCRGCASGENYNVDFNHSTIYSNIITDYINVIGCVVRGNITTYDDGGYLRFRFCNNTFESLGKHTIAGSNPNTPATVLGAWLGNTCTSAITPIVNGGNLKPYDGDHGYMYEDNSGGFLERYPKKTTGFNGMKKIQAGVSSEQYIQKAAIWESGSMLATLHNPIWEGCYVRELGVSLPFFAIGTATAYLRLTISATVSGIGTASESTLTREYKYTFVGENSQSATNPASFTPNLFNNKVLSGMCLGPNEASVADYAVLTLERL